MRSPLQAFDFIPVGTTVASIALSFWLAGALPLFAVIEPPFNRYGHALIAAGVLLIVYSLSYFLKHQTDPRPSATPTALIVEGPYRYSRNPIYLGDFLVALGAATAAGSLSAFLPPLALFFIADRYVIPREEAKLTATFGDRYTAFCAATPRWMSRAALRAVLLLLALAVLVIVVEVALLFA